MQKLGALQLRKCAALSWNNCTSSNCAARIQGIQDAKQHISPDEDHYSGLRASAVDVDNRTTVA